MSFKIDLMGKQFETNIEFDLGIFDNRVQFTTDVYSRKAFDLVDFVTTGYWRTKKSNRETTLWKQKVLKC
jgi:hypothetical protein